MYPLPAYTLLAVRFHQHLSNENQFLEPRSPRSYRKAEERLRQREDWVRDQYSTVRFDITHVKEARMHASAE